MQHKKLEKKLILKKKVKISLIKILCTIIIFLFGMILIKHNEKYKEIIQKELFESSIKFTKTKKLYNKYFGTFLPLKKTTYQDQPVFNEKIEYQEKHKFKEGVLLNVEENYLIPSLESGIVIYIGEKENYGKTIIIEQMNGIDTFYSNIEPTNIKLYDYVEKGSCLGKAINNKLYLFFQKDGQIVDYKKFI